MSPRAAFVVPPLVVLALALAGCGAPTSTPPMPTGAQPDASAPTDRGDTGVAARDAGPEDSIVYYDIQIPTGDGPVLDVPGPDTGAPRADTGTRPDARLPDGGDPLPDLTVDGRRAMSSVQIQTLEFAASSCEIMEGCVRTPGRRRLLRFDTMTPNVGAGDMHLGRPSRTDPRFEYSSCHGHYHFNGYARYRLLDARGNLVASGHKQAFCLLDSTRVASDAEPRARYNCGDQGIQAGWADIYGRGLACQWVDITDVAPGSYQLEIAINHERVVPESNYENNVVRVPVTVPPP